MDQQDVEQKIEELVRRDPRYRHDAYPFVANAVTFTVGRLPKHRHVSAFELLHGVRDYAQKEFGVLAQQVLDEWGIHEAADVGSIVYSLIGAELLSASQDDSPEEFEIDFPLIEPESGPPRQPHAPLPKID